MAGTVTLTTPVEGVALATWAALAGAENGDAMSMPQYPDKSVVVTGTGSIEMEGSNDGINWVTLNDSTGSPIAALSAAARVIGENTIFIRPVSTGAAGMTVTVVGVQN